MRRSILQEAERIAHSQIDEARRSSEELMREARREVEGERRTILRRAEHEALARRRRTGSATDLEIRRREMGVRERLIREVIDGAVKAIVEMEGQGSNRTALVRLLVEAARQAGEGSLVVQVATADAVLVTADLLHEAERMLAADGFVTQLQAGNPASITGGVIVVADEGRLVVDNSLESRLERLGPSLRRGIWRIMSDGKE